MNKRKLYRDDELFEPNNITSSKNNKINSNKKIRKVDDELYEPNNITLSKNNKINISKKRRRKLQQENIRNHTFDDIDFKFNKVKTKQNEELFVSHVK